MREAQAANYSKGIEHIEPDTIDVRKQDLENYLNKTIGAFTIHQIRRLYVFDNLSFSEIAYKAGTTRTNIERVFNNLTRF